MLQAGAMGRGGEIFVLDMGEPMHILDLAKRTIEMSGYRRSGEIDILFTGVRPGEKLFEELQYSGESIDKTRHPKITIGKIAGVPADELAFALSRLREPVCPPGEWLPADPSAQPTRQAGPRDDKAWPNGARDDKPPTPTSLSG